MYNQANANSWSTQLAQNQQWGVAFTGANQVQASVNQPNVFNNSLLQQQQQQPSANSSGFGASVAPQALMSLRPQGFNQQNQFIQTTSPFQHAKATPYMQQILLQQQQLANANPFLQQQNQQSVNPFMIQNQQNQFAQQQQQYSYEQPLPFGYNPVKSKVFQNPPQPPLPLAAPPKQDPPPPLLDWKVKEPHEKVYRNHLYSDNFAPPPPPPPPPPPSKQKPNFPTSVELDSRAGGMTETSGDGKSNRPIANTQVGISADIMDILIKAVRNDPNIIPGLGDLDKIPFTKGVEKPLTSKSKENEVHSAVKMNQSQCQQLEPQPTVVSSAGSSKSKTSKDEGGKVPSKTDLTAQQNKEAGKDEFKEKSAPSSMISDLTDGNDNAIFDEASAKIDLIGINGKVEDGGKPVNYNKNTLKIFDKKFRLWEKQFEEWKQSNQNHPDKVAYKTYMGQWDAWRQQLIRQRRFIIDNINKVRLESYKTDQSNEKPSLDASTKDIENKNKSNKTFNSQDPSNQSNVELHEEPKPAAIMQGIQSKHDDSGHCEYSGQQNKVLVPNPFSRIENNSFTRNMDLSQQSQGFRDRPFESSYEKQTRDNYNWNENRIQQKSLLPTQTMGPPQDSVRPVPFERKGFGNQKSFDGPSDPVPRRQGYTPAPQNTYNQRNFLNQPQPRQQFNRQLEGNRFGVKNPMHNQFSQRGTNENPFELHRQNDFEEFSHQERDYLSEDSQLQRFQNQARPQMQSHNQTEFQILNRPQGQIHHSLPSQTYQSQVTKDLLLQVKRQIQPKVPFFDDSELRRPPKNDTQSTVIDYGHGQDTSFGITGGNDDLDEYREEEDDDINAVRIDYGHGNKLPVVKTPAVLQPDYPAEDDDYYEEYKKYEGQGDNYLEDSSEFSYGYERSNMMREPPMRESRYAPPYRAPQRTSSGEPIQEYVEHSHFRSSRPPLFPIQEHMERQKQKEFEAKTETAILSSGLVVNIPVTDDSIVRKAPPRSPPPVVESPSRSKGDRERSKDRERDRSKDKERDRSKDRERDRSRERDRDISSKNKDRDRDRDISDKNKDRDRKESERNSKDKDSIGNPTKVNRHPADRARDREVDRSRAERSDRGRSRDRERGRSRSRERGRSRERSRDRRTGNRNKSPIRPHDRGRDYDRSPRRRSSPHSSRNDSRRSRSPVGKSSSYSRSSSHQQPQQKYQTILIEDILNSPGRSKRPSAMVIILRGLPGSGKSFVAKLIKEREIKNGGQTPRILSLDDYFITKEIKTTVKDPSSGKDVESKNMEYEYDQELESKYRHDLIKIFKKTVDNGYFKFIIIDCINDKLKYFNEIINYATGRKFQVYIAETESNVTECTLTNIHNRSRKEIEYIQKNWETLQSHLVKLDVRTLLQDDAIQDVEMEDVSDIENIDDDDVKEDKARNVEVIDLELEDIEDDEPTWAPSKWETSEEKLNKLDGLGKKKKVTETTEENKIQSMGGWLKENLPDDYLVRPDQPGKKRVRWADIEERREQERAREIGFVVGQTNWNRMTDPTFGSSALTKTKFI